MWTYLAIFLSISTVFIVFLRRAILLNRKKVEPKKDTFDERIEEAENEIKKKKRVSRDDKDKVKSLVERANVLIENGNDEEAIKCLIQALTLDEGHNKAKYSLAMLYMNKEMFGAATALLEQLALSTGKAKHYSHLGLAYYKQSSYDDAVRAYQKAVEIDDTRPQRFISLCQVYRLTNKPNNAIIALQKALDLEEDNVEYMILLADLLIENEEIDQARDIIKKALEIEPENSTLKELNKELKKVEK